MAVTTMIGAKIHRREDPRLITGRGRFVDDMQLNSMLHVAFVRSPYGHARIKSIELTTAAKAPGVVAVYTARDFDGILQGAIPVTVSFVPEKKQPIGWAYIAKDEVRYHGEIVAVVVAREKYQAADAATLVNVDYEQLPAVVDLDKALEPKSPTAHVGIPDNVAWDMTVGAGDVDTAFAQAEVVVKERILQQRLFPIAMEGRAVVVEYIPFENRLTMWTSSQVPHWVRLCLTLAMGIPESNIRVVAPDASERKSIVGTTNPFSIRSTELDRNAAAFEAQASFQLLPRVRLGLGYSGVIGSKNTDHGGRGTLTLAL